MIANTAAIYPVDGFREPAAVEIIAEARHPLNIAALQFEAWSPAERDILRAQPLRVMLLKPPANEGSIFNTTSFNLPVPAGRFAPSPRRPAGRAASSDS